MPRRFIRFENSALKMFRIDPLQFNDLRAAGEAADDSNGGGGNTRKSGEESDDRLICLAVHRRRGDVQLPGVSVPGVSIPAHEFGPARAGADLKRESRFHLSLFPAPLFSATRSARADP